MVVEILDAHSCEVVPSRGNAAMQTEDHRKESDPPRQEQPPKEKQQKKVVQEVKKLQHRMEWVHSGREQAPENDNRHH